MSIYKRRWSQLVVLVTSWVSTIAIDRDALAESAVLNLTLAQTVILATQRAPVVHAAIAKIASSEAALAHASAPRLPTLQFELGANVFTSQGRVFSDGIVSSPSRETYLVGQSTVALRWTVYDFGRTSNAISAAQAGVASAHLSAEATEQAAIEESATAFFCLLADTDLTLQASAIVGDRQRILAITHRLVESGLRTEADEIRAEVDLDAARLDAVVAEGARSESATVLTSMLALSPETELQLIAPSDVAFMNRLQRTSTVKRRDLAAANARIVQAKKEFSATERARLPTVAMGASATTLYAYDRSSDGEASRVTRGPSAFAQAGLTLSVPIFDPKLGSDSRLASGRLQEAQASLELIEHNAKAESSGALTRLRSSEAVFEQSRRLALVAGASLGAIEDLYAAGLESPLSLVNAQREDSRARVNSVRARVAYQLAQIRFLASVGGASALLTVR
jgi:outer membrane protein